MSTADGCVLRLRGLQPDTDYTFTGYARSAGGTEMVKSELETYRTNLHCDVNRSGGAFPVTGLDWALVRKAALHGTEIGIGWCAEDVTGMRRAMERLAAQMDIEETDTGGPSVEDILCESELPARTQVLRLDDMGGGLGYTVHEILSVKRTAVPAEMFEIPADYTKRSLADLWR